VVRQSSPPGVSRGESWHRQIAALIEAIGDSSFPAELVRTVDAAVPVASNMILAYRSGDLPQVLYDDLMPDEREIHVRRYLSGIYLVSPFYQAFVQGLPPGFYALAQIAPQRFHQSEYYREYYRPIGVSDLAGYLVRLGPSVAVLVTFARAHRTMAFTRAELRRLGAIEPVVRAAVTRHWGGLASSRETAETRTRHRRMAARFEGFGASELTGREREVVRLLLLGHSSKAIARSLDITSDTVRVHRKHIYAKLGVRSQGELFSRFLASLSDAL